MTRLPYRDLRIGRWLGPTIDDAVSKSIGNALEPVGAAVVAGDPRPRTLKVALPIHGNRYDLDSREAALRMRRQLEALVENDDYRQLLYFAFAFDDTLDGWVALSTAELTYVGEGGGGISMGEFKLEPADLYRLGTPARNREARRLDLASRLLATTPRDYRLSVYSTDFAGATLLAPMVPLPPHSTDIVRAGGRPVAGYCIRRSIEGDVPIVTGKFLDPPVDGEVIHYERDAGRDDRQSDVVIHDPRVGAGGAVDPLADVTERFVNLNDWTITVGANLSGDATQGLKGTGANGTRRRLVHDAGNAYTDGLYASAAFKVAAAQLNTSVVLEFANEDESRSIRLEVHDDGASKVALTIDEDTVGIYAGEDVLGTRLAVNTYYFVELAIVADRITWSLYDSPDRFLPIQTETVDLTRLDDFGVDADVAIAASERLATTPSHFALEWIPVDVNARIGSVRVTALRDVQAAFGWEEVYGPGQGEPLTGNVSHVLSNGVCRVAFDAASLSLAVDDYRPGIGWVRQGLLVPALDAPVGLLGLAFLRSHVLEWTPEAGTIQLALYQPGYRAELVVTLRRGDTGPTVELYTRTESGAAAGGQFRWLPELPAGNLGTRFYTLRGGPNNPIVVDSSEPGTVWNATTITPLVTTDHPAFVLGPIVAADHGQMYAPHALIPMRAGGTIGLSSNTPEIGGSAPAGNAVYYKQPYATAGGYCGMKLARVQRALTFEATPNGGSGTAATIADANAFGGFVVQETQGAATNKTSTYADLVTQIGALGKALGDGARVLVLARIKQTAAAPLAHSLQIEIAGNLTLDPAGAALTTSIQNQNAGYAYVAAGEGEFDGVDSFAAKAWRTAGAGNFLLDRFLIVTLERRALPNGPPAYDGVRDVAAAAMADARAIPVLVDR